ncbi:hypothetical protein D9757_001966 [Collybiopsis confluens]|uniref:DNA damage-binding protein 1 n=1 Tax=Collybiopsis confluens TaxID=2823264 RepID=A0A8H5HXJ2_9AGAR|nr:hypothetical protein D9757_001966 [Collybiopsis confluens]
MPTRTASTFHSASSVISSVKCSLLSGELEHLVVAKINSLEVYSLLESKLQLECTLEIRGKVRLVRAIPVKASPMSNSSGCLLTATQNTSRCNLFVLLDHPDPEVLVLNYTESGIGSRRLNRKYQISLEERGSRPSEFCTDVLIHSSGDFAVVSCYTGKLKVISLDDGQVYNLQIFEHNLLSFTFLPLVHEDNHALALLYLDHNEKIHIIARNLRVYPGGAELDSEFSNLFQSTSIPPKYLPCVDELSPRLIPIPAHYPDSMSDDEESFLGGILVVGGRELLLYELEAQEVQEKHKGKRKREGRMQSQDAESGKKPEFKERKPKSSVRWPWSRISAWTGIDMPLQRILIGDVFGRLTLLSLTNMKDFGMVLVPLGETSPATTISYLTNQVTFVGSHLGDSQLLRISDVPVSSTDSPTLPIPSNIRTVSPEHLNHVDDKGKGSLINDIDPTRNGHIISTKGSYLDVIETHQNIAPIRNAILANLDGNEQAHIVTCSGGGNSGSLNILRLGADFEELASMPGLPNITNLWPFKYSHNSPEHSYLVTTSLIDTHVFQIASANEMLLADRLHEFVLTEQTLHFGNMVAKSSNAYDGDVSLVVQVNPTGAHLFQHNAVLQKWTRVHSVLAESVNIGGKFVAASGNSGQLLVAQVHGCMMSYTVQREDGVYTLEMTRFFTERASEFDKPPSAARDWYNSEISAVDCPILEPAKHYSPFVAAGFWHTNQIKIYHFDAGNIEYLCQSPPLASAVRSVLLSYMTNSYRIRDRNSHLCIFAGLADGSVATFEMVYNEEAKLTELKHTGLTPLGYLPVSLAVQEVEGNRVVIAAGDRTAVFSWERSHLRSAPVMLKDITAVRVLHTGNYNQSLMLAGPFGMSIGRITSLDKMHIHSTLLGLDIPRQVVHDPTCKVFGLSCLRTLPSRIGEDESMTSSFKILDDSTLKVLAQIDLEHDEHIMSSAILSVPGSEQPLFCLGTMIFRSNELEPTSGRIHVYKTYQPSPSTVQLKQVISEEVGGCVYNLVIVQEMIAAAVNSSVFLYRVAYGMKDSDSSVPEYAIEKIADWNHNYLVTSLSSYKDHLVVADQFSSVSLLKVNRSQRLTTVARDYSPLWPVSVESFDNEGIIGADQSLNLFIFSLGQIAGRTVLKRDGFFHWGDLVTSFIRGTLTSSDTTPSGSFKSTHIFCTLSGQIGVIVDVLNEASAKGLTNAINLLTSLEERFPEKFNVIGGVSHARYRAPRTSKSRSDADEASFGILDGDFLEQLLGHIDTNAESVQEILDANDSSYSLMDLKKDLEVLQNLH